MKIRAKRRTISWNQLIPCLNGNCHFDGCADTTRSCFIALIEKTRRERGGAILGFR